MEKSQEIIPPDLTCLAPNEELAVDFAMIDGKDVFVIKDRQSGWISAYKCKSKKTEAAIECMEKHMFTFGLPTRVMSDGGPAFQGRFTEFLKGYHVNHYVTPAHHPSSNGLVERGVRSLKDVYGKQSKPMTKGMLKRICFEVNNHPQRDGSGTANEKFLRRGPRTMLPNSIKRELRHRDLVQRRQDRQMSSRLETASGYAIM